jgi:hypothetical protein
MKIVKASMSARLLCTASEIASVTAGQAGQPPRSNAGRFVSDPRLSTIIENKVRRSVMKKETPSDVAKTYLQSKARSLDGKDGSPAVSAYPGV